MVVVHKGTNHFHDDFVVALSLSFFCEHLSPPPTAEHHIAADASAVGTRVLSKHKALIAVRACSNIVRMKIMISVSPLSNVG